MSNVDVLREQWSRFSEALARGELDKRGEPPKVDAGIFGAAIRWRCPWIGRRRAARWARALLLLKGESLMGAKMAMMELMHRAARREWNRGNRP